MGSRAQKFKDGAVCDSYGVGPAPCIEALDREIQHLPYK